MRVPRRVGGVVHRGGLSGGNAVPRISSLGTVEGARPAVQETLRTGMIQSRLLRRLGLLAALAAGYFVAGKVGLQVAYVHPSATVVWPPSGLTLAAFLLLGYEVWPAILLGAFLVNITTAGDVATSAAIAAGNTLEGLVGAYLVNRFARGHRACERARDIFKLAGLAALGSTAVSATAGVAALSLAGFARWTDFGPIWSTWWMGDAVSDLVIAPAVLLWTARPRVRWTRRQALEAVGLLACLAVVGIAVFGELVPWKDKHYPLEFLCVPLLLWVAFRFEQRDAATVVVLLAGVAIWGTLRGYGPFARPLFNESLLLLQAFQGVSAVITLVLAAAVAERTEAVDRLRRLAVSDPLTGLSNYRQLAHALDAEIRRSSRTDRPFAVVLMDLDGLKKVNDRYGHLVGSMALRRVAEALLGSCRGIDTAARFGGDEFALVLPETGDAAAWHVARRVADRVARDGEQPPLSVSVGVAVHPRDGATLEALLNAADRSLYDSKARRHGEGLPDAAARAAGAAVWYALGAGTVVSLLGFALTDALFHLMGVPPEVTTLGRAYLDTWLLGGPLVFGFFAIEATFRASGDTRTPFLLLMASVVLSVGLDPLLISGIGPFPRLGVEGAAR